MKTVSDTVRCKDARSVRLPLRFEEHSLLILAERLRLPSKLDRHRGYAYEWKRILLLAATTYTHYWELAWTCTVRQAQIGTLEEP